MKDYTDFMMVLSPPASIKETIALYKQDVMKIIGNYESMHSIAHISIATVPRQKPFLIEPKIYLLERKLKTLPPVSLTIDGFDYFNHGNEFKTIYARIRPTPTITKWFKELKKPLNIKQYLVPHITVARNISTEAFNALWPHFKAVKWTEPFTVNCLTALHREAFDSFEKWQIYKELPFEGKIPFDEINARPNAVDLRKKMTLTNQQISLF